MHTANPYESETLLAEYLLFHYGAPDEILPFAFGPVDALGFPVRCVSECLSISQLGPAARALDLGCAVGRSSFELARSCREVLGIDRSHRFITAARTLAEQGSLPYTRRDEGDLTTCLLAQVPDGVDRSRVRFAVGDAMRLSRDIGPFDVVLMANVLDRLREPRRCLRQLRELVAPGGQVIITSPYTWLTDFTPREHWLGGVRRGGRAIRTLESLHDLLDADFAVQAVRDLPLLLREHERKYQWCVAQATRWVARATG